MELGRGGGLALTRCLEFAPPIRDTTQPGFRTGPGVSRDREAPADGIPLRTGEYGALGLFHLSLLIALGRTFAVGWRLRVA